MALTELTKGKIMKVEEFLKLVIETEGKVWDGLNYMMWEEQLEHSLKNYNVEQVDSKGGYEGGGEHMEVVLKITKDDDVKYVKVTGYYSSWDSSEWHAAKFVEPKEKTITVYE